MSNLSVGRDFQTETLTLHNDISEVPLLNNFIKAVASRLGFEPSTALELQLAVEEAVVNVMDYAYPPDTVGMVTVATTSDGQSLEIVISDSGTPFDPTQQEKADISLSVEERQIGGLGIFLVNEIMDTVSYERKDGKNVLTLTKQLNDKS
jgi:anti-sigma regulatory factor (Ser/Thr protein kinase)